MVHDVKNKSRMTLLLLWLLVGLSAPAGLWAAENLKPPADSVQRDKSKLRARDPVNGMPVASLMKKLQQNQGPVIIDVRRKDDFEKCTIPGAINIPLFAVKTKTFLKGRPLVLVNEGFNYEKLEQTCQQLRDAGFEACYLIGGLNRWRERGGTLIGDALARATLNRVSPENLFEKKDRNHWLPIDISSSPKSESSATLPRSLQVPFRDESSFIRTFLTILAERKTDPLLTVLIFNENGDQYRKVEKVLNKTGIGNLFFLEGGAAAYKIFCDRQAAFQDANSRSVKRVETCVNCR